MPAITVDDITVLPRITDPDPMATRQRPVRTVTSAPRGFEGEGFPVRRAFAGADLVLKYVGADLGAEKFLNIKCRLGGLNPEAAVIVATVRALKMHGGVAKEDLGKENIEALKKGITNLARHVENVKNFGVPPVVAAR